MTSRGRPFIVAVAVALIAAAWSADARATPQQLPIKTIRISTTTYLVGDVPSLVGRIAKTPSVRFVLAAIRACPRARAYGFASSQGAGLVAWVPDSIFTCFGTSGGGPLSGACLQGFHTPQDQDPTRVSGLATSVRYYVLIAATSARTCAHLSTQAPGGVWARTTAGLVGLPAGSLIVVKCQAQTTQGLVDYVAPAARSLPASRPAFSIFDRYVPTGFDRLDGVPACSGVNF